MALLEKIEADLKTAMKNKEKEKTEVLRSIKTAIMLARTEKGADKNLSEDKEVKILQKLVKQRKESAEIYQQQGRKELAEMELNEAKFIEDYLPEQMSDAELTEIINKIIKETGAESMKDMGKVMGIAQKQLAGKADGKVISDKVKSLLS